MFLFLSGIPQTIMIEERLQTPPQPPFACISVIEPEALLAASEKTYPPSSQSATPRPTTRSTIIKPRLPRHPRSILLPKTKLLRQLLTKKPTVNCTHTSTATTQTSTITTTDMTSTTSRTNDILKYLINKIGIE